MMMSNNIDEDYEDEMIQLNCDQLISRSAKLEDLQCKSAPKKASYKKMSMKADKKKSSGGIFSALGSGIANLFKSKKAAETV